MKINKSILGNLAVMLLLAAVYRVLPGRPYGFAPQMGIALFAGAVFSRRIWAFVLPLAAMLLSDVLYQVLYIKGLSVIPGFYEGQWVDYLIFASIPLIGFMMKKINLPSLLGFSLASASWFFLISNFAVWAGGTGWAYPKTFAGLMSTYVAGLPFYGWSLLSTVVFAGLLFGLHSKLFSRRSASALVTA